MNIEDIENSLPNGFHDALLMNLSIDFLRRKAEIDLDISIDDPYSEKKGEMYRKGRLTLINLLFCAIEPPDSNYPYQDSKKLRIVSGSIDTLKDKSLMKLPSPLPEKSFTFWFFVQQWNAFIYFAATDASFNWKE